MIGALSKADSKGATTCSGNYQESVTTPLTCDHDNNAAAAANDNPEEDMNATPNSLTSSSATLSAIERVSCSDTFFRDLS